jgi:hypothetical protein
VVAVPEPAALAPTPPSRPARTRDRAPRREERRQPERARDADDGDRPVTGFGVDIPAFMLLAKSRAPVRDVEAEPEREPQESES